MDQELNKIRFLIGKDKIIEAIAILSEILKNDTRLDEIILQSARNNRIKEQIRNGVVEFDDANLTRNKVNKALLDICREIEEFNNFESRNQEKDNNLSQNYFNIEVISGQSYIHWKGNKNIKNPEYIFQIPIRIKNGNKPSQILSIDCTRYVQGLPCYLRKPEFRVYKSLEEKESDQNLWIRDIKNQVDEGKIQIEHFNEEIERISKNEYLYSFLSDYKNLSKFPKFEKFEIKNFIYHRKGSGPTSIFNSERLENGEYKLVIEYNHDGKDSKSKTLFIEQINGFMREIKNLSPPPLLNNILLLDGFKQGIISKNEKEILMSETTEQQRFLLLLEDEDFLTLNPNLNFKHLKLCFEVNRKLINSEINKLKTKDVK